ncbi:MAG: non-canonical purine NTP pyrophosphatase [Candidatus Binataceae bacterium]
MNRLVVATTNPAKLAEYRLLLRGLDLQVVSLQEVGISETPEETGATFKENALLKARFCHQRARLPTLADDGGLEVDALGGAPGIHSHRWLGADASDDRALAEAVVARMADVEDGRRTARLRAAVALVYENGGRIRERVVDAALEGVIARSVYAGIRPGFPYRAVMWMADRNRFLAELGEDEEAKISQRRTAISALLDDLRTIAAARPRAGHGKTQG